MRILYVFVCIFNYGEEKIRLDCSGTEKQHEHFVVELVFVLAAQREHL